MRGVECTTIMNEECWEKAKSDDPYEKWKHSVEEDENEEDIFQSGDLQETVIH